MVQLKGIKNKGEYARLENLPMNVLDAITSRKSIRAFLPEPVPKHTIEQILQVSRRAPSGTNTQPWHVYVCTGSVKQAITDDVLALVRGGGGQKYEDHDDDPPDGQPVHRDRRRGVGWSLYGLLGIPKGDRAASAEQAARNVLSGAAHRAGNGCDAGVAPDAAGRRVQGHWPSMPRPSWIGHPGAVPECQPPEEPARGVQPQGQRAPAGRGQPLPIAELPSRPKPITRPRSPTSRP